MANTKLPYPPANANDNYEGGQPAQENQDLTLGLAAPPNVAPNSWDSPVVIPAPLAVRPDEPPLRAFDISGDVHLMGSRTIVEQPGTMSGDPQSPVHLGVRMQQIHDGLMTRDQASDKFSALQFLIDNKQAYQLLPPDPFRKRATIIQPAAAAGALALFIGPEPLVDNGGGFPLYAGNNNNSPFIYTSKAPLYAIGVSGTAVQVNVFLERFDDGMPIN
jgi:hypothetical protein